MEDKKPEETAIERVPHKGKLSREERIKVLEKHQFPKGVSGNPKGRPVRKPITDAYLLALNTPIDDSKLPAALAHLKGTGITALEVMAMRQVEIAINRSKNGRAAAVAAAKEIADRIEGKVPLRVSGADGGAIQLALDDPARLARIEQLLMKAQREPAPFLDAEVLEAQVSPTNANEDE